jgi:hypothetical protein
MLGDDNAGSFRDLGNLVPAARTAQYQPVRAVEPDRLGEVAALCEEEVPMSKAGAEPRG